MACFEDLLLFVYVHVGSGGGEGADGVDGPVMGVNYKDYTVEYAKSNKSTCRGCDEKIAKVSKYIYF